jgi:hypothetical protein
LAWPSPIGWFKPIGGIIHSRVREPIEILGLDRKNVVTKPEKYNSYDEEQNMALQAPSGGDAHDPKYYETGSVYGTTFSDYFRKKSVEDK